MINAVIAPSLQPITENRFQFSSYSKARSQQSNQSSHQWCCARCYCLAADTRGSKEWQSAKCYAVRGGPTECSCCFIQVPVLSLDSANIPAARGKAKVTVFQISVEVLSLAMLPDLTTRIKIGESYFPHDLRKIQILKYFHRRCLCVAVRSVNSWINDPSTIALFQIVPLLKSPREFTASLHAKHRLPAAHSKPTVRKPIFWVPLFVFDSSEGMITSRCSRSQFSCEIQERLRSKNTPNKILPSNLQSFSNLVSQCSFGSVVFYGPKTTSSADSWKWFKTSAPSYLHASFWSFREINVPCGYTRFTVRRKSAR